LAAIREEGVVLAVGEDGIRIRITPASADRCASCGACGQGERGDKLLRLRVDLDMVPGARVLVEVPPASPLLASVLLLLVPLLGLLLGAGAGGAWGPRLGLGHEVGAILGGLAGLVLAYLGVVGLDRRMRAKGSLPEPRIVGVLGDSREPR
jgi:positive regulator of sigma E activity